jgi:hypothetical protein
MMLRRVMVLVLCFLFLAPVVAEPPATIDVVLWFDTEDYILPASDDAALHLANWLTEQKIPATFKVVGEKALTLERRKRTDVIDALKKHEIGYHSNWHSVPPTPAQYLESTHWQEGIAEFTRREKPGYDDVARIFGQKPSCYGQPGSSWGPHSHVALHQWGMRIYFDAGSHINVEGKPFYYGGLLNFYKLSHLIRTGIQYPHELETAKIQFLRSRDQLLAEKGGVISIVYHPCEFVHQQFWDGVNFKHGANPPRFEWKLPPQKTEAETRLAYDNFQQYVLFMKRFPEVRFVTASQVAARYADALQSKKWTAAEVSKLAVEHTATWEKTGIHWVKAHGGVLSAAEVFWLTTMAATATEEITLPALIQGPGRTPQQLSNAATRLSDEELLRVVKEMRSYLHSHQQIPPEVWVGSQAITPENYLLQLMQYLERQELKARGTVREQPFVKEPELLSKKYVADDHPNLWKWVIFPPGFSAPQLMAQAKRQAWNLKPAIRSEK